MKAKVSTSVFTSSAPEHKSMREKAIASIKRKNTSTYNNYIKDDHLFELDRIANSSADSSIQRLINPGIKQDSIQSKKKNRQNAPPNLNSNSEIIQQVSIETAGGTWDTSKYEAWGPEKPDPISDPGIGAEISLSFMPGKGSPFGKKIGLIQSVTALAKGKPDPTFDEAVPLNKSGRAIDRSKGESGSRTTNPVYGAHNTRGNVAKKLTDNVPDNEENTFGLRNRFSANKAATLWDKPSSEINYVKGEISKSFETTAVVLEGKKAGTYLGSVGWGYRRADGENEPKLDPTTLKLLSHGNPSEEFTEAAAEWNAAEKNNGEDLVKIPIPKLSLKQNYDNNINLGQPSSMGIAVCLVFCFRVNLFFKNHKKQVR